MRRPILLAVITAAAVITACGDEQPSDESAIKTQVERYFAAVDAGNGEAACQVLTDQARQGFETLLEGAVSPRCPANVEKLARVSVPNGAVLVSTVNVTDGRATAHMKARRSRLETDLLLVKDGDSWKLSLLPAAAQRFSTPPGIRPHAPHDE
jgi:hypothetical protein